MEIAKQFIKGFLALEAACWSKSEGTDLDSYNESVRELYRMAIPELDEAFGIFEEDELESEDEATDCRSAYLFKLSAYVHKSLGKLWIGYTSYKNPLSVPENTGVSRGFFISKVEGAFKIIGIMTVALNDSTLEPVGWEKSFYNPPGLTTHDFGEFLSTERYLEPKDDGFSLQDYQADK